MIVCWKNVYLKKWVYQAIKQFSEEDYDIQLQRVTIANLISHIKGPVPQRLETVFFNVADKRDRDKEFERGLHLSKKEALTLANESFDIIQILEDARLKR